MNLIRQVFWLCAVTFFHISIFGQLPVIEQPIIPTPTTTIYIAPNGNDMNIGSFDAPKKSFSAAIQALPFGIMGVNDGNAYGEIILKNGHYYPTGAGGIVQNIEDWRKAIAGNYVYKNISIKGMGQVYIYGDSLKPGSQLLYLSGNGISVKNIHLLNSKLHGLAIVGSNINHHNNILIDSVNIEGAIDNGIWVTGYDNVLVQHSKVKNTCLRNFKGLGACSWASALRIENSYHVTINSNHVYQNWGEGINTSYTRYVHVFDNKVNDNYSVNVYCHSSSLAIYSHNLIYNTDSIFWRYCGGSGGRAASGISLTNELTCTNACLFYGNTCGSNISCCAELDYDNFFFKNVLYHQLDSVFVFNNIVLDAGIDIWDSFSGFNNYSNISNVLIKHNDLIGISGNESIYKYAFSINLQTPFINYKNIALSSNIIATDTNDLRSNNFLAYVPHGICNGSWSSLTNVNTNLWNHLPFVPSIHPTKEKLEVGLPYYISYSNLEPITPSISNAALDHKTDKDLYIQDDFFHRPRNASTTIGAIEYYQPSNINQEPLNKINIYPNPANNLLFFNEALSEANITITSFQGKVIRKIRAFNGRSMDVSDLLMGIYIMTIEKGQTLQKNKFCILR